MKFFRSKKRVSIVLVVTMFLIMYLLYYFFSHQIAPVGTELSENQLVHDLKVVGNKYDKTSIVRIFANNNDYNVKNENALVDREGKVIYVLVTNKLFGEVNHPFEVRAAIRTWLYLKDRILPYSIAGVKGDYNRSWGMFGHHTVLISKSEFQKLYDEAVKNGSLAGVTDTEQLVNVLSDRWIEENHYNNWWDQEKKQSLF